MSSAYAGGAVTRDRFKRFLHDRSGGLITNEWSKYLIFDRDSIFSTVVVRSINAMGTKPVRTTAYRSPWQNGVAERWIVSCRRELLEHVVNLGE